MIKEELAKHKNLQQHQNDLKEFSDTAAILNQMDLIISVDTSVAHLVEHLLKEYGYCLIIFQIFVGC